MLLMSPSLLYYCLANKLSSRIPCWIFIRDDDDSSSGGDNDDDDDFDDFSFVFSIVLSKVHVPIFICFGLPLI